MTLLLISLRPLQEHTTITLTAIAARVNAMLCVLFIIISAKVVQPEYSGKKKSIFLDFQQAHPRSSSNNRNNN
jgi:hypothetical protein